VIHTTILRFQYSEASPFSIYARYTRQTNLRHQTDRQHHHLMPPTVAEGFMDIIHGVRDRCQTSSVRL